MLQMGAKLAACGINSAIYARNGQVTMCSNPNLEGPSLQNIRLMHPPLLFPFWPPSPADVGARPVALIVRGALSSVIPQTCLYIKITRGLTKIYTDSWTIAKLSDLEPGQELVHIF